MIVPFDERRRVIFEILHGVGTVCAVLFNLILLYVILTKTTERLRSYAVILFASAFCDLMVGVFSGVTMMRLLSSGFSLIVISHGVCHYYGPQACIAGQSGLQTMTTLSIYLIPISFWYRHRVLYETPPLFRTMVITCLALFVFLQVLGVFFAIGGSSEEELREALRKINFTIYPEDTSTYTLHRFQSIFRTKATPLIITLTCAPFPCLSIGMYYRRKIVITLNANAYSPKTKKLQQNFVAALTLHCGVVMIFLSIATIFMWRQLEIPFYDIPPYFEESLFMGIGLVPVINPLITINFVLPYRRAVLAWFKRKRRHQIQSLTNDPSVSALSQMKTSVY